MLSTIDKVIALQDVDVFAQVSSEELGYLAAIVVEETLAAGGIVYREGDMANAMYLVISGRVRLHRDELEITIAVAGESFGTWSLFDDEPRMSAATALEETHLLRLDKEDFIDLLADSVEITEGVLKALVGRVRGLIGRVGG